MNLVAKQIYDKLIYDDKILVLKGQLKFFFGDVGIVVKQKDVLGNIIQEWMQEWLIKNNIDFLLSENTQTPPDFYLNPDNRKVALLEIKAFNRKKAPGFDIADFRMYAEEIIDKPYMLDTDYLIFGYDMSGDGIVTVKDLWLKKVWEITSSSKKYPIKLQVKSGVVHKIRPCTWYGKNPRFKPFETLNDFVSAIEETVYQNRDTRDIADSWKRRFSESYKEHKGEYLQFPRWYEIRQKYQTA